MIYRVEGQSMEPTIRDRSYIVVVPVRTFMRSSRRQDIVLLKEPWPNIELAVKRIIAVPGDCVGLRGELGLKENCQIVESKEFFVEGDNTGFSTDSRDLGVVSSSAIIGPVFLVVWPLSELRFVN
jgi:signal peptidase I